jgi:glycosyltransferase involved in cell wall biosynthesis
LVNVGLISPWKRQVELLEELIRLRRRGYEFRIVFAGQASQDDGYGQAFFECLSKCERDGFASHVGYLSSSDVMKLMDESHGMVHCPSEEAFGLVAGEAMARGLKFFGTRTGGLCDIAGGIPGAELHPDIETLVQNVAEWLRNGAERNEDARAIIRDRYHPSVIAARHVEIYSEVLNRGI